MPVSPQIINRMCYELFHVTKSNNIPPDNVACYTDGAGIVIWNIDIPDDTLADNISVNIQIVMKDKNAECADIK